MPYEEGLAEVGLKLENGRQKPMAPYNEQLLFLYTKITCPTVPLGRLGLPSVVPTAVKLSSRQNKAGNLFLIRSSLDQRPEQSP